MRTEDTFSPDNDHRWMGSIATNAEGDICMGYSISSRTTYPSIGVACSSGEDDEHRELTELVFFDGNVDQNVQRETARWGNYSAISIDPADDTFWYTQEFAEPNQSLPPWPRNNRERFGWATKIVNFDVHDGN